MRYIFNPSTENLETVDNVTSPLKPLGEKFKLETFRRPNAHGGLQRQPFAPENVERVANTNFENISTTSRGTQISNVKNEKLGFIYPHKTIEGEITWRKVHSELKGKYDITKEPPIKVPAPKRYKFDIDKNKWVHKGRVIGEGDIIQKSGETFKQFNERLKDITSAKKEKAIILQGKSSLETRKTIDTWTKNWLDKNLPKKIYTIRDQKKFINDLKQDYKAFVKKNYSNKIKIGQVNLFSKDGLPNLSRSISEAGTSIFKYEGFKTVDLGQRGNIPITKNPTKWLTYEPFLRKIFYKNKIRTNPKLFNNIKEYFNFITTNKRVIEGRELMRNFKPDPDVLYLLDSNKSKLNNAPKGDIFSSFGDEFKTSYDNYRKRMFMGENWKANAKIIEDILGKNEIKRLTGADTIKLAMDREGTAMKKIFDYTKLPEDLKLSYAVDHGQGISAAAKSGNKNLMKLAVTDLIGSTAQANTELGMTSTGQQSFESKRSRLVQAIVGGDTSKLKELNEITEKAYGKKKVYKIVDGELISSRISSAKDASGRYKQYIEKIAKISVAKKEIIKQSKINPELKKIVKFLNLEDSNKLSSTIQSILNKQNSGLNVVDIAKWGRAELSALDDIAGKIPSKALGAFGKLLKVAGIASIPLDVVPFVQARDLGIDNWGAVGGKNLAEMYTNLPGMIWEAGEWVASKVQGKEHEWKPFYEKTFGQKATAKALRETSVEDLIKNIKAQAEASKKIHAGQQIDTTWSDEKLNNQINKALKQKEYYDSLPDDHELIKEEEVDMESISRGYSKDKFMAEGGRVGFDEGSKPDKKMSEDEILESIRKGVFELEQNWNTEKSIPGKVLDVADVSNWPYYAARMIRAGMTVAEISLKLPFVSIELLGKLATQPAFKVVKTKPDEISKVSEAEIGLKEKFSEGLGESWLTDAPQEKLEGTGLFTEAFKKLMPDKFAEKTGLNSLIESQEQAMQDRGMSKWPEIAGKNIEMGIDITLPFGYVAAAQKYKALKKLLTPLVKDKNVNKVIEKALTDKGMSRRQFNMLIASGGIVATLKALGMDNLFKGMRLAKDIKTVPIKMLKNTSTKMPLWFPKFIEEINKKMIYEGKGMWTFKGTDDFLPGFHIERIGDDYYITGKNDYGQEFQVTYETPRWEGDGVEKHYYDGEFRVDDAEPIHMDPDGNMDFDGILREDIDEVLGGTTAMENLAKGTTRKNLTKGEEQVLDAEMRAQNEYDIAKDEGRFDDLE